MSETKEPAPRSRGLSPAWRARIAGFVIPAVVLGAWGAVRRATSGPGTPAIPSLVVTAAFCILVVVACAAVMRKAVRKVPAAGSRDRGELGLPYAVNVLAPGRAPTATIVISDGRIEFLESSGASPGSFAAQAHAAWRVVRPWRVALADIECVRTPSKVVRLLLRGRPAAEAIEIRTSSDDDRARLLWELAVHVPDAVERGIGLDPAPQPGPDAGTGRSLAPTADAVPGRAPTEFPNAATSEIGGGIESLGSALADAPAERRPAPPRSGLGCGLFVTGEAYEGDRKTK